MNSSFFNTQFFTRSIANLLLIFVFAAMCCWSCAEEISSTEETPPTGADTTSLIGSDTTSAPDPTSFPYQNPVIQHMYTADPSPHVFPDGRVWMVTSVDNVEKGGFARMHSYHTFSSADMVNWVDHGEIFNLEDALQGEIEEPSVDDWMLWAPDIIYRRGKYYLFYPVRIIHREDLRPNGNPRVTAYTAVAVSDAPDQRFEVLNPRIEGTHHIDPAIFIDDDDQIYLYQGRHEGGRLKENMMEFATEPIEMDIDNDDFVEASWMHKYEGQYYFSWHSASQRPIDLDNPDDPSRAKSTLDFSYASSPLGPFQFGGIFNFEPGVGVTNGPKLPGYDFVPWREQLSNHGGTIEYHGQWYLFYHTAALSSWNLDEFKGPGDNTRRSVCIDYMYHEGDGKIKIVQQTMESVAAVMVNQPFEIQIDLDEIEVVNGATVENDQIIFEDQESVIKIPDVNLGSGYYYFGMKASQCSESAFEIRLDSEDGVLCGTILFDQSYPSADGLVDTFLREAHGIHDVYLVFESQATSELYAEDLRFFAGAPKM